jgi:hypothetical protein
VVKGEGGKNNYLGVFSQVRGPGVVSRWAVVTVWVGGEGEFRQRLRLSDPLGDPALEPPPQEFRLDGPFTPASLILLLERTRFALPGVYTLEVELEGRGVAGRFPLLVSTVR